MNLVDRDLLQVFQLRTLKAATQPTLLNVIGQVPRDPQMEGDVLRRHELQQLRHVAFETPCVAPHRFGERYLDPPPCPARLALDPRHLHLDPHLLRPDRQGLPPSPKPLDHMDVSPPATRTPQRLPWRFDAYHDLPVFVLRGYVPVAANPKRMVQRTLGHAGFSVSGIVCHKP